MNSPSIAGIKGINDDSFHAALTDNLGISKLTNALFNWLIIGYICFAIEREDESSTSVSSMSSWVPLEFISFLDENNLKLILLVRFYRLLPMLRFIIMFKKDMNCSSINYYKIDIICL